MRTLNVGGRQGRGDPLLSHCDQRPSMLATRGFWVGAVISLLLWIGAILGALDIYLWVTA